METKLQFKLEIYEGPLDLLLSLIDKNKINIYDIPIAFIFDQYMEYINSMKQMDMEIAGEFINMAADLMLIKSKMLLPKLEKDEVDPRLTLAATLIEYKLIKEAAVYFSEQYNVYSGRAAKEPTKLQQDVILYPHNIDMLQQAFIRIHKRLEETTKSSEESKQNVSSLINKKITSIQEKIIGVLRYMYKVERCDFITLLEQANTRSDLIAAFAAILELMRTHRLLIIDEHEMNPIFILNKERKQKNGQNRI